jgi:polar amino acid transport system substrate-binding protein
MKCLKLLLVFGVVSSMVPSSHLAAQTSLDSIRQRGRLVWGADAEGGAPFVFPSPEDPDKMVGVEVEIAELIAEHLGVQAEFRQAEWGKLPDVLNRGDIDLLLSGYEWSRDRAQRFGVSIPYYLFELQLLGRTNDSSLQSWEDLINPRDGRKKKIAVLGGSTAQEYIENNLADKVELISYDGTTDAMRGVELNLDGADANLQDLPIWIFFRKGFPDLREVGPPVRGGFYVALTRKADKELLHEINAAMLKGLQDGRIRNILSKYKLWNIAQASRGLEINADDIFVGDQFVSFGDRVDEAGSPEEYQSVSGLKVVQQRGWLLVRAAGMTAVLAVLAMPLAILAGLILALARLYGPRGLAWLATAYIELVRGTPLVLQLYVIFFLLPEIGISISAFLSAILGLAINYSAYEAEIYRAGIQAIPEGQVEAAKALGMSRRLTIRRIIVPQATRLVIPPMTNDFIALFKDTAVCSVITVVELSKEYYIQARSTGAIVELGLLTAFLYLMMSYPLSIVASRLEKRLKRESRS